LGPLHAGGRHQGPVGSVGGRKAGSGKYTHVRRTCVFHRVADHIRGARVIGTSPVVPDAPWRPSRPLDTLSPGRPLGPLGPLTPGAAGRTLRTGSLIALIPAGTLGPWGACGALGPDRALRTLRTLGPGGRGQRHIAGTGIRPGRRQTDPTPGNHLGDDGLASDRNVQIGSADPAVTYLSGRKCGTTHGRTRRRDTLR
jgi:hypothetical protein